jgi:hypothetical protein
VRLRLVLVLLLAALAAGGCGGRSSTPASTHGRGYHFKQGY